MSCKSTILAGNTMIFPWHKIHLLFLFLNLESRSTSDNVFSLESVMFLFCLEKKGERKKEKEEKVC